VEIFALNVPPVAARPLEVVERKGLGHPDTICDALVEAASRALTREYLERAGTILHHNLDKALLVAGSSSPAFGGGRVLEPMRFVLGDRATDEIHGEKIPVGEIAWDAVQRWVRENLRGVDPAAHLTFESVLRPSSAQLRGLFAKGRTAANDSSVGIGWAPLTETERVVLEAERWLNGPATKTRFPEAGEDVKVLGVRRKRKLELTIALAFVDRFVADEKCYFECKEALRSELLGHLAAQLRTLDSIDARVNVLDASGKGVDGVYLTVLGTSADDADSGAVGRGNRVNGLTSFLRPSSHEAAAGKNPRSHTGKIYNLLAYQTARLIHESIAGIEEAYVLLASRIGSPIDEPWNASVELVLSEGVEIADVEDSVREIFGRQLAGADAFVERLVLSGAPVC
jgi:S-adenosylmethionine synthetase